MPTYDLPQGFTMDDLHPHGGGAAIRHAGEGSAYTFTKGALSVTFELTETQIILPADTTAQVLTYVQNQIAQFGQPKPWEVAIDDLRARAGALVGLRALDVVGDAAQRQVVLMLVLWLVGAVGTDLRIRPLDDWLHRRRKTL